MKDHWTQEGYEGPLGLRQPLAFGSDWRWGKVRLALRLHTSSPVLDRPKYANLSASQWLSRSSISRPSLCVRWMQTCLWTIGLRPPQSNLDRDCWSTTRRALGRGSTAIGKGSRGRRTWRTPPPCPLRITYFESQVSTWESTLACTSHQFRSSWRSGPNHTPRMRTSPSL